MCNGFGVCDVNKHACDCDPGTVEEDEDGNCYPKCEDDCNGNGRCTKEGWCECYVDRHGFGYMTPPGASPCSVACGSKNFDAGENRVWGSASSSGAMAAQTGAPTCWCQSNQWKFLGSSWDQDLMRGAESTTSNVELDTYECGDVDSMVCENCGIVYCSDCIAYQAITCTFGDGLECKDSVDNIAYLELEDAPRATAFAVAVPHHNMTFMA